MNDPSPFPNPSDAPRPGNLPGPRGTSSPRTKAEDAESGERLTLDEMMARLQQSGESGSGSGSGKRRRRSSHSPEESSASSWSSDSRSREGESRSRSGDSHSRSDDSSPRSRRPDRPRRLPKVSFEDAPVVRDPVSRRKLWILGGIVGLLLAGGGVLAGIRVLNRVRVEGDGFKVNVARRVSELLGRRVTFERFREADNQSIGTSAMTAAPELTDLLETAQFTDLMLQLTPGSWMSDEWIFSNARAREIKLSFQPHKELNTSTMWQTTPVPVDRGSVAEGGFRLGISSDPSSISLEFGQFESLNLSWPGPGGQPETLSKLEGNLRRVEGGVNLEMRGGILDTAAWPPFPVQSINARLKGTALDIVGARVALSGTSIAQLSGKAELVPDGRLELRVDIPKILFKDLLPDFWASHVAGQFSSTGAQWKSQFKSGPAAEFSGPFVGHGLVLQGLPFVDKIANILRKPELTLMEFLDFRGNFSWTSQRLRLSELTAQSQDTFLKLSGWVEVVPGESISGKLRVEASEVYFAGLKNGPPPFFTRSAEGFYATEFDLSGRGEVVQDTLPVPVPVMLEKGPDLPGLTLPRMQLPPGVEPLKPAASPAPQPNAAGSGTPFPAPAAATEESPIPASPSDSSFNVDSIAPSDPPVRRQKSPAEVKREFDELLKSNQQPPR